MDCLFESTCQSLVQGVVHASRAWEGQVPGTASTHRVPMLCRQVHSKHEHRGIRAHGNSRSVPTIHMC